MAKKRLIYSNYDLYEMYDECRAFLAEEHEPDEITEEMIWDEIYFQDRINWDDEHERLKSWINGYYFMIRGYVGRWDGSHSAGHVFTDFDEMFYHAIKDCDYWEFWDENGHLYFKCSHHDGTNLFEIKRLNDKALSFLEKWEYGDDPRTEKEIHDIIWNSNFMSKLPHFAHTVYGCKRREN